MKSKLYYAPGTCALAVHIGLIWANAEYELEQVTLGSDEYKKINPMGSVPALLYNGKIMTEAGSLLRFIANLYPENKLLGDVTPVGQQIADQWISFFGTEVHKTYSRLFAPAKMTTKTDEESINAIKDVANSRLRTIYQVIENHLNNKTYMLDTKLSLLDAYLYVMTTWMPMASTLKLQEFPNLNKHFELLSKDAGVLKARQEQGI